MVDRGGDNVFLLTGSGDDDIATGPGADLIVINKTSGSTYIGRDKENECNEFRKPKRFVLEGVSLKTKSDVNPSNVTLIGSFGHHDVLSMANYIPNKSSEKMIVLLHYTSKASQKYKRVKSYLESIDDVADRLFENTKCTRNTKSDPLAFCQEAEKSQPIFSENIERFELSRHTTTLLLFSATATANVTHEVIGGPRDDYVINAISDTPLMAQMGAGANRLCSGKGDDSYSVILDEHKDIIFDKGGENTVAIMLPEGVSFKNVFLAHKAPSFVVYRRDRSLRKEHLLEYIFHNLTESQEPGSDQKLTHRVQFRFTERSGKEIVFQRFHFPNSPFDELLYPLAPSVDLCYSRFYNEGEYDWYKDFIVESVTPAKGQ